MPRQTKINLRLKFPRSRLTQKFQADFKILIQQCNQKIFRVFGRHFHNQRRNLIMNLAGIIFIFNELFQDFIHANIRIPLISVAGKFQFRLVANFVVVVQKGAMFFSDNVIATNPEVYFLVVRFEIFFDESAKIL